MNIDNQVTIIEIAAEYLCLIVLGEKLTIDELIKDIEDNYPNDTTKYISVKINTPMENKRLELLNKFNKDIILDEGVESAQCRTYAEGYNKDIYMLMTLDENYEESNEIKFGFPKFDFGDEEYPENIIENWFKKKLKKSLYDIKKNIKPIAVIGSKSNILVVATKIKNKKKRYLDEKNNCDINNIDFE